MFYTANVIHYTPYTTLLCSSVYTLHHIRHYTGTVQRRLSNGLRVNMVSMAAEPQRVAVRLFVPGKIDQGVCIYREICSLCIG